MNDGNRSPFLPSITPSSTSPSSGGITATAGGAASVTPLTHTQTAASLSLTLATVPPSLSRVRPRPPRNELNRKTESEGEELRDSGRAARSEEQEQHWIGMEELDVAARGVAPAARRPAGSCSCYRWPAGRRPPPRARHWKREGRTHRTTGHRTGLVAAPPPPQDTTQGQSGGARHKTRRRDAGGAGNESETWRSGTECET